jgi:hypothetical protein
VYWAQEARSSGPFLAYYETTAAGEQGEHKGDLPLQGAGLQLELSQCRFTVTVRRVGVPCLIKPLCRAASTLGSPRPLRMVLLQVSKAGHKNRNKAVFFTCEDADEAQTWHDTIHALCNIVPAA